MEVKNTDEDDGVYQYMSNIKSEWEPESPVYKLENQDKYLFRNITWMIGNAKDLSTLKNPKSKRIKLI